MPHVSKKLATFFLSADEIRQLNPEWKDQMIQDYLDMIRNIAILAQEADNQFDIDSGLEQLIMDNAGRMGKMKGQIAELQARQQHVENVGKIRAQFTELQKIAPYVENNGKTRSRLNGNDTRLDYLESLAVMV